MELDWSEQSPHIRTLFRPWQLGDGLDEASIITAEERIGVRLPTPLRAFYLVWGQRRDLTRTREVLLRPDVLVMRPDALIFCVENQAVLSWAVLREALEEVNPPVVVADAQRGWSVRQVDAPLTWMPSHKRLSDFLDDLTYAHALAGGAAHGGVSNYLRPQPHQISWLEEHWNRATVTPMIFQLRQSPEWANPTLYIRDSQALVWMLDCRVAVGEPEALDEISQALQITWQERW